MFLFIDYLDQIDTLESLVNSKPSTSQLQNYMSLSSRSNNKLPLPIISNRDNNNSNTDMRDQENISSKQAKKLVDRQTSPIAIRSPKALRADYIPQNIKDNKEPTTLSREMTNLNIKKRVLTPPQVTQIRQQTPNDTPTFDEKSHLVEIVREMKKIEQYFSVRHVTQRLRKSQIRTENTVH